MRSQNKTISNNLRRAYVREVKKHHPDCGGTAENFLEFQEAYNLLTGDDECHAIEIFLPLADLFNGCIATATVDLGKLDTSTIEFVVPPFTYPGTELEFSDNRLTSRKIRIILQELVIDDFKRHDSDIIIERKITKTEATAGIILKIANFDKTFHHVAISPQTTADQLIFNICGHGFCKKNANHRGNLIIIVTTMEGS